MTHCLLRRITPGVVVFPLPAFGYTAPGGRYIGVRRGRGLQGVKVSQNS